MAEVLTYDSTPDAEVMNSIESDQAESLAIGEALMAEQDQLLAGKYKSAQDLEKAYIELQKKLGKGSSDEDQEDGEYEDSEYTEEEYDEDQEQDEDVQVNLLLDANQEFAETGQLSDETLAAFSSIPSEELVQAYMRMQASMPPPETEKVSLSNEVINEIQNSVGGEEAYQQLVGWASDNFSPDEIEAFDAVMDSGDTRAINFAIQALYYRYTDAMGYEGETVQGKPPKSTDVFRSQAELVRAMSDPRYDRDPAYRQDVIAKLERSDIDF